MKNRIDRVGLFINKLKQVKDPNTEQTVSTKFRNWLLDLLEYGFLFSTVYAVFISWPGFLKYIAFMVGFGILRYVFLDLLQDIVRRIKE